MAPRPNWKGYLKLSCFVPGGALPRHTLRARLVSHAQSRYRQSGARQFVDEQTGEPVETENQAKGYEVGKGEYIVLEDDEVKSVQIESNHTIDIERFVPRADIDELYLDTPYYLAPTDRVGEEAFAVIRDAMRTEKMVGLARVVLFRRERLMMLEPRDKGIVATSLHYANEVHAANAYFEEIPDLALPKEMLELAKHIIEKMPASSSRPVRGPLREGPDRADPLQAEGHAGEAAADAPADQRRNLMDALRRSVEGEELAAGTSKKAPTEPSRLGRAQGKARTRRRGDGAAMATSAARLQPQAQLTRTAELRAADCAATGCSSSTSTRAPAALRPACELDGE
jgi:DNA end-binding protein Ku